MTEVESGRTKPLNEQLAGEFEERLWQRAEDLSEIREPLVARQAQLFQEVDEMQRRSLNLHEQERLRKKESTYWRINEKIQTIENKEDEVMDALKGLEEGTISEERLLEIVPEPEEDVEQLSKRKQRIKEERERLEKLGNEASEIEWDMYAQFGADPTRLTTGRHKKRLKGSYHPSVGAGEFFYQTADTHGGKVKHGKRGNTYTTRGGKRIRKR